MKPLVLGNLSYGMYAIGVKDGSRPNACIANTVMQISKATPSDAALVAVALSKENYSCQCVEQEGIFSISVLSQDTPATVIGALGFVSGRGVDKLGNIRHKVLIEGVPVIKENTCCWFLCKVQEKLDLPGQVVFVAEIIAGSDEAVGTPMTYKYYVEQLGGASPKYSPTYLPPARTFDKSSGESFVCSVCGYVYRDQEGLCAEKVNLLEALSRKARCPLRGALFLYKVKKLCKSQIWCCSTEIGYIMKYNSTK